MENKHYKRWKLFAPLGLLLVGAGLSLLIDAGVQKFNGLSFWEWVAYGTFGLIVFNSGLSIFGEAILERVRYEREAKD
ncbi:MAG: hypothetical protein AAF740_14500 [Bacteroidota bacterium]